MHAAAVIRRSRAVLAGVAGASAVLVIARVAGMTASFLFVLLLARALSPADVGAVMTLISSAFLASLFVTLNIESGSIRFIVEAQQQGREIVARGFLSFGRILIVASSIVVATIFVAASSLWSGESASADLVLVLAVAASIPFIGWLRFTGSIATAVAAPLHGSAPRTFVQPVVLLAVFSTVLLFYAGATPATAGLCFLIACMTATMIQFAMLRAKIGFGNHPSRDFSQWRNWVANGVYLSPLILLQENLQYAAVFAASLGLSAEDVAVYAVAIRFIAIARFGVLAVNVAVSAKVARAFAAGDTLRRDNALREAALLRFFPTLAATILIVSFAGPVLSVFGESYVRGASALAWFTLMPLSAALFGPNQMLLNIAGHRRSASAVSLAALAALIAATALSGRAFGIEGAAAATAITYALWEFALFLIVKSKLGTDASVLSLKR